MNSIARNIAVVAPASIPNSEGLDRSIELLHSWGHRVVLGQHVHDTWRYSAGLVEKRAEDLRWALEDGPSSFCVELDCLNS